MFTSILLFKNVSNTLMTILRMCYLSGVDNLKNRSGLLVMEDTEIPSFSDYFTEHPTLS